MAFQLAQLHRCGQSAGNLKQNRRRNFGRDDSTVSVSRLNKDNHGRSTRPYHYTNPRYPDHTFSVPHDRNPRYPPGEYPEGTEPGVRYAEQVNSEEEEGDWGDERPENNGWDDGDWTDSDSSESEEDPDESGIGGRHAEEESLQDNEIAIPDRSRDTPRQSDRQNDAVQLEAEVREHSGSSKEAQKIPTETSNPSPTTEGRSGGGDDDQVHVHTPAPDRMDDTQAVMASNPRRRSSRLHLRPRRNCHPQAVDPAFTNHRRHERRLVFHVFLTIILLLGLNILQSLSVYGKSSRNLNHPSFPFPGVAATAQIPQLRNVELQGAASELNRLLPSTPASISTLSLPTLHNAFANPGPDRPLPPVDTVGPTSNSYPTDFTPDPDADNSKSGDFLRGIEGFILGGVLGMFFFFFIVRTFWCRNRLSREIGWRGWGRPFSV